VEHVDASFIFVYPTISKIRLTKKVLGRSEDDYDDYDYYEQPDENAKSLKDCVTVVFQAIIFF